MDIFLLGAGRRATRKGLISRIGPSCFFSFSLASLFVTVMLMVWVETGFRGLDFAWFSLVGTAVHSGNSGI